MIEDLGWIEPDDETIDDLYEMIVLMDILEDLQQSHKPSTILRAFELDFIDQKKKEKQKEKEELEEEEND